jgi:hypothetical protein
VVPRPSRIGSDKPEGPVAPPAEDPALEPVNQE